ncbi:hypothetical protein ABZ930_12990 [Streptomyces sp. NPDC046716]|uniref:hypothetical protein n=1 Tax=Streptomyces sp. NPDC046716 TaxID=3157093 RepID=UPI003411A176
MLGPRIAMFVGTAVLASAATLGAAAPVVAAATTHSHVEAADHLTRSGTETLMSQDDITWGP